MSNKPSSDSEQTPPKETSPVSRPTVAGVPPDWPDLLGEWAKFRSREDSQEKRQPPPPKLPSVAEQTPPSAPSRSGLPQRFDEAPVARASAPTRKISLARCRVTDVREQGEIEEFISEERRIYPNHSKAPSTQTVGLSHSFTRTVTIEASKLRAHNSEAGVTLFGFAAIQAQVQRQLNQRYSIEVQDTIIFSEQTTIEIPPYSTIKHVIKWKLVSLNGIAILGVPARSSTSLDLAELPYEVPLRLTFEDDKFDVPQAPQIWTGSG
jgi:hypothetical protein